MERAITPALDVATEKAEEISGENFSVLVQLHQRQVYRVIFLLLRDHDAADTLTQECFLRAYAKRASFRGECNVRTWLLRIAVNLVRDNVKSRRASFWRKLIGLDGIVDDGYQEPSATNPSPERALLARERLDGVWHAIESLSPQQREIFLLRFSEEMSLAEIATVFGLQIGSVKSQLSRAISKIRELLKEEYGKPNQAQ